MITLIIIGVVVAVVLFAVVGAYNRLVKLDQSANQSFADIDVQLKQRQDLIPNLVETVKGYATHERGTLDAVTQARAAAAGARTVDDKVQAENMLTGALGRLFATHPPIEKRIEALIKFAGGRDEGPWGAVSSVPVTPPRASTSVPTT